MIDLKNSLHKEYNILIYPLNGELAFSKEELGNYQGYVRNYVGSSKIRRLLALMDVLRKNDPKLIQAFDLESGFYARLALILCRKSIPLISGYGAGLVTIRLTKWLLSLGFLQPDIYICNSEEGASDLRKYLRGSKEVRVIRNGIDPSRFNKVAIDKPSWASKQPTVGYIGKLDYFKRGDKMIKVAKQLYNHPSKPHFVIIGKGEYFNIAKEELRKSSFLQNSTTLLGDVPNAACLIKFFDIGVLCSKSEGLPNILLEYMALGVPSVSTNVGDVAYVLEGGAGIVTKDNTIQAIVNGIRKLLDNDVLRREMSIYAKDRFMNRFDISIMSKQYEQAFSDLLSHDKTNIV